MALQDIKWDEDSSGLNHRRALVNSAYRKFQSVKKERITHPLAQHLGGGFTKKDGLLLAVLVHPALDDPEVLPYVALPLPAGNEDHGEMIDRDQAAEDSAAAFYPGEGSYVQGDVLGKGRGNRAPSGNPINNGICATGVHGLVPASFKAAGQAHQGHNSHHAHGNPK